MSTCPSCKARLNDFDVQFGQCPACGKSLRSVAGGDAANRSAGGPSQPIDAEDEILATWNSRTMAGGFLSEDFGDLVSFDAGTSAPNPGTESPAPASTTAPANVGSAVKPPKDDDTPSGTWDDKAISQTMAETSPGLPLGSRGKSPAAREGQPAWEELAKQSTVPAADVLQVAAGAPPATAPANAPPVPREESEPIDRTLVLEELPSALSAMFPGEPAAAIPSAAHTPIDRTLEISEGEIFARPEAAPSEIASPLEAGNNEGTLEMDEAVLAQLKNESDATAPDDNHQTLEMTELPPGLVSGSDDGPEDPTSHTIALDDAGQPAAPQGETPADFGDRTMIMDDSMDEAVRAAVAHSTHNDQTMQIDESQSFAPGASPAAALDSPKDSRNANEQTFVMPEGSPPPDESGPATVYDPRIDQTMVSSEYAAKVSAVWGTVDVEQSPNMTIKSDSTLDDEDSNLVIKQRSLKKIDEKDSASGDYQLMKVLGEGGMGVVYAARQASIDRTVAIKMVKAQAAVDKGQRQKFLAEAAVTGELDHPNIVPIYDLGTNDSGALFYSMKCVRGTPWMKVVRQKSLQENIEILMKVADAVAFAHSRGVVHRDLKPENVMLGDFGEVLVMDWGLAMSVAGARQFGGIVQSKSMGGTPAYMAPEMATGPIERIGPASDVYLLGAILYEIITHKTPHTGSNPMQCLFAAAKNEIQATQKSGELLDIAMKAMATSPEARFATVRQFQDTIREYQSHSESIALSTRAEQDLKEAEESGDYQHYSKALFGFQEAFELWSGNARAKAGLSEARLVYARSAMRKGDYDLGISLLDSNDASHADLRRELQEALGEREARQQRLKTAKRVLVGLVAIVLVVVGTAAVLINEQKQEAVAQRVEALKQRAEAEKQADIAERQKRDAEKQREIADGQRKEAERQRLVAEREQKKAEQARTEEAIAREKAVVAQQEAVKAKDAAEQAESEAIKAKEAEEYEAYIARIGLAAAKIDENAFGNALQLLNGCKPELRNWEWGRLMHLCSQSSRTFDVKAPVDALAISPDDRQFITGSWNSVAQIWDVETGKLLLSLPHGSLYVHAVAYAPTGKLVATGGNDKAGYVKVWDAETGALVQTMQGHTDAVLSVAFSRDAKRLLTSSYDKTARLWNVETGALIHTFQGHTWWVWDAAFSHDEQQIVTASQDGTAIVWNTSTGAKGPPFTGHLGPVYSAAFSPNGDYVATGGYDKRVLVWKPADVQPYDFKKLAAGEPVAPPKFIPLDGHTAGVRSVSFSQDGALVLSGGHDNTVKVWEPLTGRSLKTFRGHDSWVRACAFSNDGRWIISGSHDHHAKLWSIADYEEIRVLQGRVLSGHSDAVLSVQFSPDGKSVVTSGRDRTAKTWDLNTGRELHTFNEGHAFLASSAVFFPDGKRLASGAVDNTVRIWDVATGTELSRLDRTGRSAALALSHDAAWLLTGSDDKTAKLWNAETGRLVRTFTGHNSEVSSVCFSPDDQLICTGDSSGRCIIWDVSTGEEVHRLMSHTRRITACLFLDDGKRLLTASGDKTVGQWDVATGQELVPLVLKHPDAVLAMAAIPGQRQVLTSCADNLVRKWDVDAGKVTGGLGGKAEAVNSISISADARHVITVNAEDRTVNLWDLVEGREVRYPSLQDQLGPFLDFKARGGLIWSAIFSPDGSGVLTVGGSDARLWDLEHGEERMTFSPHGAVASASFSPDGTRLVTGSWDNSAKIWDVENGKSLLKLEGQHAGYVNCAVFSPTGKLVLTASDDKTAKLWDATTGAVVRTLEGHSDRVRSAVFSRTGDRVLTASNDKTARIWDAETGEPVKVLQGHHWAVLCGAISRDGKLIVTGSEDNTARVWDPVSGETLLTLEGHTASVTSVAISPDGRRVLTGSQDNTAKLWDSQTGKEILSLKGHSQEVTSVTFSSSGKEALTGSRDGTAIVWLAVDWKKPVDQPVTASRKVKKVK